MNQTPSNQYYGISISPDIEFSDETMQESDDALIDFYRATSGENSRLLSAETAVSLYDGGFLSGKELETGDFTITVDAGYLPEHPVCDTADGAMVQLIEGR